MSLSDIVARNISRVARDLDWSSHDLAKHAKIAPRTALQVLKGDYKRGADLATIEAVAESMRISPAPLMFDKVPTNVLISRRLDRLIKNYISMDATAREELEEFLEEIIERQVQREEAAHREVKVAAEKMKARAV